MKIDVVMPVHNEEKYLRYSLPSLLNLKGVNRMIFVLDNCSDSSESLIRRTIPKAEIYFLKDHKCKYFIQESFQFGFDQSNGDVVLATGGDIILDPNIIDLIRSAFEDEQLGTVCFRYLNYDLFSLKLKVHGFYGNLYKSLIQRFRKEARHTGFYAFRKEMMNKIGGLKDVPSEYDEFCLRTKSSDWKLRYIPHTNTLHLRVGLSPSKQYIQGLSRFYLPHYSFMKTFFHSFIHFKPHLIVGYLHAKYYGVKGY